MSCLTPTGGNTGEIAKAARHARPVSLYAMKQRPTDPTPGRLSCTSVQPVLDGPALSSTVRAPRARAAPTTCGTSSPSPRYPHWFSAARTETCLLYTSDAADEEDS